MTGYTATTALTTQARWTLTRAASMAEKEDTTSWASEGADSPGFAPATLTELAALVAVMPSLISHCAPGRPDVVRAAEGLAVALAELCEATVSSPSADAAGELSVSRPSAT